MRDTVHGIFTWIGLLAVLVAVTLPVLDRFVDAQTQPPVVIVIGIIGVLAVGSKQVTETAVRLIEAWRQRR